MWKENVLLVLLFVAVLLDLGQAKENKKSVPRSAPPRTFNGGKAVNTNDTTLDLLDLQNFTDHVMTFKSGILSTRIIPAAYMATIVIGIPSNILVLFLLIQKTKILSSAILYINLTVSNLLLLISLLPKVHYGLNGNSWVFGEVACKLVTACFYGNMYCSIYAHMCISVLRYLAVVHPFLYKGLAKRSCTSWASMTVWLIFGAAMTPEFLIHQSYVLNNTGIVACHDVLPYEDFPYKLLIPYRLCLIFLGFVFPFAVIAFAYGCTVHQLSRSCCDFGQYIKASTLVFLIFLLCFTPSNTIHFIHYVRMFMSRQDDFYIYFRLAVCACCFHSCLDPFLAFFITKATNSRMDLISLTTVSQRTSTSI